MRASTRALPLFAALALAITLPACAPRNTGNSVPVGALGSAGYVTYGTVVGSRPVQVQGHGGGIGTVGGAVAGGLAGSFIGGDWRSNALAGLGGALVGGLAGTAIERGVASGPAMEFIVREDRGGDIQVVQTNEEALQVGDRVVISRSDRVRLARAAGAPAPAAQAPYPQQGYPAPQAYPAPQGYPGPQAYPGPEAYPSQQYYPISQGMPK